MSNICTYCGEVNGRLKNYKGDGKKYCEKHYAQLNYKGKIIETTKFDKNRVILYDDYAELVLLNNKYEETGRALVSLDKLDQVTQYKWHLSKTGYVCSNSIKNRSGIYLRLHRLVANPKENEIVDHINRNKLDCRNENLRCCNHSQNHMNKSVRKDSNSGITGVYYVKRDKLWRSEICVNGEKIYLGCFKSSEEAKTVRRNAELIYFKDFAPIRDEVQNEK